MSKLKTQQNLIAALCTAMSFPGATATTGCESNTHDPTCYKEALSLTTAGVNVIAPAPAPWFSQVKAMLEASIPGISIIETVTGQLEIHINPLTYLLTPVNVKTVDANIPAGITVTSNGQIALTTSDRQTVTFAPSVQEPQALAQFLAKLDLSIASTDDTTGTLRVNAKQAETYFVLRPDLSSESSTLSNTPGFYLLPYLSKKVANINAAYLVFKDANGQLRQQVLPPMPAHWEILQNALNLLGFSNISMQYDGMISATAKDGETYNALMDYSVIPGKPVSAGLSFESTGGDKNQDGVPNLTVVYPNGDRQDLIIFPDQNPVFTLKSSADAASADAFLAADSQPVTLEIDLTKDSYKGDDISLANFAAGDKIRFNTADGIVAPGAGVQHSATANQYLSNLNTANFQRSDRIIHAESKSLITLVSSRLDVQKASIETNSLHIHLSGGIKNNNLQFEFF